MENIGASEPPTLIIGEMIKQPMQSQRVNATKEVRKLRHSIMSDKVTFCRSQLTFYATKKTNAYRKRWSCAFVQTAGKSLSVMTTVQPEKFGQLLPTGVIKVYMIWKRESITGLSGCGFGWERHSDAVASVICPLLLSSRSSSFFFDLRMAVIVVEQDSPNGEFYFIALFSRPRVKRMYRSISLLTEFITYKVDGQ